jgi:hypothetical protein
MAHLYCTVFPPWFQPQDPQSFWHNHPLLPVIKRGDTFEKFQTFEGCSAASGLMRHHASDSTEENLGRSTVVERARFFGVDDVAFVEEVMIAELEWDRRVRDKSHSKLKDTTYLVTEEAARDIYLLASHNDDLLAVEDLLG